jgi:hypothetical protein
MEIFVRIRVSGGVGDVDRRRARINHRFDDGVNIGWLGAARVLHEVFDVVGEFLRRLYRAYADC